MFRQGQVLHPISPQPRYQEHHRAGRQVRQRRVQEDWLEESM
jgi:hypothetical protein